MVDQTEIGFDRTVRALSALHDRLRRNWSLKTTEEECKQWFVTPFLRDLGVHIDEPDAVMYERSGSRYASRQDNGRMDYVLYPAVNADGTVATCTADIEAKADLSNGENSHVKQLDQYWTTIADNVDKTHQPLMILTDGRRWFFHTLGSDSVVLSSVPFYQIDMMDSTKIDKTIVELLTAMSANDVDKMSALARISQMAAERDLSIGDTVSISHASSTEDGAKDDRLDESRSRANAMPDGPVTGMGDHSSGSVVNSTARADSSVKKRKRRTKNTDLSSIGVKNGDKLYAPKLGLTATVVDVERKLVTIDGSGDSEPRTLNSATMLAKNLGSINAWIHYRLENNMNAPTIRQLADEVEAETASRRNVATNPFLRRD